MKRFISIDAVKFAFELTQVDDTENIALDKDTIFEIQGFRLENIILLSNNKVSLKRRKESA